MGMESRHSASLHQDEEKGDYCPSLRLSRPWTTLSAGHWCKRCGSESCVVPYPRWWREGPRLLQQGPDPSWEKWLRDPGATGGNQGGETLQTLPLYRRHFMLRSDPTVAFSYADPTVVFTALSAPGYKILLEDSIDHWLTLKQSQKWQYYYLLLAEFGV